MGNIVIATLMLPFWYLSYFINRNKKKIIFGSWYGERYADNPRYLFESFSSFKDYESYWITRNKIIYRRLKSQNKNVLLANSISGIYHSLTAGVIIYSSGKKDVNPYFINGAIIINLWHGAPLKKICKMNDKVNSALINKLKGFFLPNIYEYNIDYVLSTSKVFDHILSKSFGANLKNVLKFGYPRNDSFFLEKEVINNPRKICYLPTFRDGFSDYDLYESFGFDLKTTEEFLRNNNCEMYLGSHFVSKKHHLLESNVIFNLPNDLFFNINEFLVDVDILITDYSGAYFDFLLTKKPIILAPFDIHFYTSNCRDLNFNYYDLKCDLVAYNWNEILISLKDLMNGRSVDKTDIFNDYHDGNSTKKLINFIKSL